MPISASAVVAECLIRGSEADSAGSCWLRNLPTPRCIPPRLRGYALAVEEITTRRDGTVDVVEVLGELDLSNVHALHQALKADLSDQTTSCLLDLFSHLSFLDSSVVKAMIRWSTDAQLSERESLAIVVGKDTPAERLFELVGLTTRLPIFQARDAATALVEGQRARTQRTLEWLTDAELTTARSDAQAAPDLATRQLDDITEEEHRRREPPR